MATEDDEELDDATTKALLKLLDAREAEKEKAAKRAKPPKDFAEAVDRIADAVLDKLDARVEARRREREEADDEPTRTPKAKGPLAFLMGSSGEDGD